MAALALVASGCGGGDDGGAAEVTALPSSSCTGIEYEGEGDPDYLIASDFPLQGSSRTQTEQIVASIRLELENREWKAGDYNIAYQSCDDATAQAAKWDSAKCSANGNAYAGNDAVIGVIGTFNSGCAQIIAPLLNAAPDGGIAMISPANTYVCLTAAAPACEASEPDKYYPSGTRNYVRVVANDAYQGAAVAEFAQSQGVKNVYVLNDKEAYGLGVATNFRDAAESLGIGIAGFEAWDPKASSYEALMNKIKGTGADAVFLGGLIDENGAQVIKDKVAVLGPNDGAVKLFAPDGFTTQATIDEAGGAAAGMYMSVAGVPIDQFAAPGAGVRGPAPRRAARGQGRSTRTRSTARSRRRSCSTRSQRRTAPARTSSRSCSRRASQDGLLGTFTFSENGDPVAEEGATVAIVIYRATDKLETETTITSAAGDGRRSARKLALRRPIEEREGIALPPLPV